MSLEKIILNQSGDYQINSFRLVMMKLNGVGVLYRFFHHPRGQNNLFQELETTTYTLVGIYHEPTKTMIGLNTYGIEQELCDFKVVKWVEKEDLEKEFVSQLQKGLLYSFDYRNALYHWTGHERYAEFMQSYEMKKAFIFNKEVLISDKDKYLMRNVYLTNDKLLEYLNNPQASVLKYISQYEKTEYYVSLVLSTVKEQVYQEYKKKNADQFLNERYLYQLLREGALKDAKKVWVHTKDNRKIQVDNNFWDSSQRIYIGHAYLNEDRIDLEDIVALEYARKVYYCPIQQVEGSI